MPSCSGDAASLSGVASKRRSNGWSWGRGTLDMKQSILGTLEAIEILLAEGFSPERTIYLAFGHDEEIGGQKGAAQIAKLFHDHVPDEIGSRLNPT